MLLRRNPFWQVCSLIILLRCVDASVFIHSGSIVVVVRTVVRVDGLVCLLMNLWLLIERNVFLLSHFLTRVSENHRLFLEHGGLLFLMIQVFFLTFGIRLLEEVLLKFFLQLLGASLVFLNLHH
jgi:hypothetical protein